MPPRPSLLLLATATLFHETKCVDIAKMIKIRLSAGSITLSATTSHIIVSVVRPSAGPLWSSYGGEIIDTVGSDQWRMADATIMVLWLRVNLVDLFNPFYPLYCQSSLDLV